MGVPGTGWGWWRWGAALSINGVVRVGFIEKVFGFGGQQALVISNTVNWRQLVCRHFSFYAVPSVGDVDESLTSVPLSLSKEGCWCFPLMFFTVSASVLFTSLILEGKSRQAPSQKCEQLLFQPDWFSGKTTASCHLLMLFLCHWRDSRDWVYIGWFYMIGW